MAEVTLVGLRVVLEVGRTGSFSAAAERLGYTQSAVSRQIAATESVVGGALFERHARGVRPTAAGEVLIRHAGRVLDDVTAAGQELAGLRDRLVGRLVVGAFPTAAADLAPARDRSVAGRPSRCARATERGVHAGATAGPASTSPRGGRGRDRKRPARLRPVRATASPNCTAPVEPESRWPTPTRSPLVNRSPPRISSTSRGSLEPAPATRPNSARGPRSTSRASHSPRATGRPGWA